MEMFDFAIRMEKDGLEFFTQAAESVSDQAARNMLLSLANDEKRHIQIIIDLKEGRLSQVKGQVLAGVKNVFQQLADDNISFIDKDASLTRVLEGGLSLERKSIGLYHQLAQETSDPQQKKVWQTLEGEEKKHEKLLSLTLEYLDKPNIVLENAEFLFYDHNDAP